MHFDFFILWNIKIKTNTTYFVGIQSVLWRSRFKIVTSQILRHKKTLWSSYHTLYSYKNKILVNIYGFIICKQNFVSKSSLYFCLYLSCVKKSGCLGIKKIFSMHINTWYDQKVSRLKFLIFFIHIRFKIHMYKADRFTSLQIKSWCIDI